MQILVYMLYVLIAIVLLLRLWWGMSRWSQRFKVFLYAFLLLFFSILINVSIINPILWFSIFQRIEFERFENYIIKNWFFNNFVWIIFTMFVAKAIEQIHNVNELYFWYLHGTLTGVLVSSIGYRFMLETMLCTLCKHSSDSNE
jgi:hypothetical protein